MRFGFGIISVLLAIAIMLWLTVGTGYLKTVSTANKQSRQQINVISGKSDDGAMLATDSIRYKVVSTGNKSKLIVTSIIKHGPMDDRFGLRMDDQIVELGPLDVAMIVSSRDDATAFLHDAYARNYPITVLRNGQKLTLPTPEHLAEVAARKKAELAAATSQPVTPATPATPEDEGSTLQKALDSIRQ